MQHLGNAVSASHGSPEVDMPVDEMMDVGAPWTTTAAVASPVGDQAVPAASGKAPYASSAAGGAALGAKMDHGPSTFEVDIGGAGGSLEDFIASGVNDFFDVFSALEGPDGGGFADGMSAADQGMEVDDDELAWLNGPDVFMPLPIMADADGLVGQVATTATPTGVEEAGMGPGAGDENMEEDVGSLLAALATLEATAEIAPVAAAAVAATTMLPTVALEIDTAEVAVSGMSGGDGEYTVSPQQAPAAYSYDFGGGGGEGARGAGNLFAGGPADGAAVAGAVGAGVAAAAMTVTPTATNTMMMNSDGGSGSGGGHDGGLSQKELIRRQKVERYLSKKSRRRWSRASSYQSRQRVANSRPRHKGRFLPLVSDFVPVSELKRRHRALLAQQAEEEEGEKQQASFQPPQAAPEWGAGAEFPADADWTG